MVTVSTSSPTRTLSTALGVVSLTLGVSEVLAPAAVAGMAGVPATRPTRRVIRLLGVRECGHGAAILLGSPRFVWTRVVGDALDVAMLVQALRRRGANRRRGAIALGVLSVIGAADAVATAGALDIHTSR